jgi:1-acyl-sn-glycerol-3-phosphate acyltransferase
MAKDRRWVWWTCYGLAWLVQPLLCRLQIEGRENIPATGGAVVACNHNYGPDFVLLGMASRRELRFMAKAEAFAWHPILAAILRGGGVFPVQRGKGDSGAIVTAVELAKDGDLIAMFPEGTRSKNGALHHGKSGAARIALAAQVPIVPAAVINSALVLKRSSWQRPSVTVRFGKPISWAYNALSDDEADAAHAFMHEVMVEIARMLPPDLRGEYREAAAVRQPVA